MTDAASHQEVFIHPGEFYYGSGAIRIITLLGSCVAIALWHPGLRHGGMCHFMLDSRGVILDHLDGRFADEAMELFMIELGKRNTLPAEYQAKVFGGSNMLGHAGVETIDGETGVVGAVNIQAARHLLKRHGFKVASSQVGGSGFRYVMFDLWNGDVWVKRRKSADIVGAEQ